MPAQMRDALEKAFTDLSEEPTATGGEEKPPEKAEPIAEVPKVEPAKAPVVKQPRMGEKIAPVKAAPKVDVTPAEDTPIEAKPVEKVADKQSKPAVTAPTTKAPQSWKPAVREEWAKIPASAQEEIIRREKEITSTLSQSAASRKLAEDFTAIVRPYEHLIRSSGVEPLKAVQNLMNTAAGLQVGTPQQKASIVAEIIKNYGVDIPTLDQMLSGSYKPGPESNIERMIAQRMAPVDQLLSRLQSHEQQTTQQLQTESASTIEQFEASGKAEFLEDVREDMADLLEVAARRGRSMTLEQAYEMACNQHPDIAKIVEQRRAAEKATAANSAAHRARLASASLPAGAPASMGGGTPTKGRRAALEKAFDDLSSA